jgi:hypothetical protein
MTTRLFSQALSLALAGVVTLAVLGAIDQRAAQPQHAALLAQAAQATAVSSAPATAPQS